MYGLYLSVLSFKGVSISFGSMVFVFMYGLYLGVLSFKGVSISFGSMHGLYLGVWCVFLLGCVVFI